MFDGACFERPAFMAVRKVDWIESTSTLLLFEHPKDVKMKSRLKQKAVFMIVLRVVVYS